jgi:hypothetical protein
VVLPPAFWNVRSPFSHGDNYESLLRKNAYAPQSRIHNPNPQTPQTKRKSQQQILALDEGAGLSSAHQQYEKTATVINELRVQVDRWRAWPNPKDWQVTPETERLCPTEPLPPVLPCDLLTDEIRRVFNTAGAFVV